MKFEDLTPDRVMNRFCYAGLTDQGRVRLDNQDRWVADEQRGLFVVADGMGGSVAGALAAQIVVETLPLLLQRRLEGVSDLRSPQAREQLCTTLAELSSQVFQQSQGEPGLEGMGSTVVVALVRENEALIGHLGDSRAYLFRDGRLDQLTRDHSLIQLLLDAGEITREDVPQHPARGQLTRYVGMTGEPLPEARFLELHPGDRLLLCSDGLSGMLTDAEIRTILEENVSPATACERLIATANAAGGRDNITVVIVAP